jgi:hypothetical protein
MLRILAVVVILPAAIDYFAFDSQHVAAVGQYIQKVGWTIQFEVARILERGR